MVDVLSTAKAGGFLRGTLVIEASKPIWKSVLKRASIKAAEKVAERASDMLMDIVEDRITEDNQKQKDEENNVE